MAAAPTLVVNGYFTIVGSSTVFVLGDATQGVLGSATYLLGGDIAVDIAPYVTSVSIQRGRSRALDQISAGVASVVADNRTRVFDPAYTPGVYYGNIRPGKRVTIVTGGKTRFDGKIDDWNYVYPVDGDSTAEFDVVDALAALAAREFDEWTSVAGQTTGERITSILDRNEVAFPTTSRAIDVGTSTLQADLITWGSNVLNYAQLITQCDLGQLFAAKDGRLTFYGRNRSVTAVGAPEFRDDGTGIAYSEIAIDYGTELLFNRVSVDATGFTKQTVTDQTSIDLYGTRSLSLSGLPLETEQQALDIANYLLNLYKLPESRFASITLLLHGMSTVNQASILDLDLGSVVRVVFTPNRLGTAIDKICLVEGIDDVITPTYHAVTLRLSNLADGFSGHPFILDDATAGLLDGAYVLAF